MTQTTNHSLQSTPLGLIASDWKLGAVGDFVAELKAGVSVNAVETEGGCAADEVGVLKSGAVLQGKFFPEQHKVVVPTDRGRVATSVRADRIIISRMNTPALVGESGYVAEAAPHLFLPDRLWQTEPSNEPHSQRWLSYWLQHPALRALIAAAATGTSNSMKNISNETVLSLPVPRTPRAEQTRIAAILTAVDDKLDVIARQIEATQTLKQGLMQTLFSRGVGTADTSGRWVPHLEFQRSEMGEVPATWRISTLGECSKVIYRYPGFYGFEPLNQGVPVVRGEHIKNGRLSTEWSNYWYVTDKDSEDFPKTALEEGDIVMAVRGTVGNFAIVGSEHIGAQISPNLIRISPDHKIVDRAFFYFQMDLSATLLKKSFVQSQALPSLSAGDIKRIAMPIPPILEQQKIGEILGAVETKLAVLSVRQSAFKQLKKGLMQKLLTGEWRVKVDAEMAA